MVGPLNFLCVCSVSTQYYNYRYRTHLWLKRGRLCVGKTNLLFCLLFQPRIKIEPHLKK